jgi:hypothetical protein
MLRERVSSHRGLGLVNSARTLGRTRHLGCRWHSRFVRNAVTCGGPDFFRAFPRGYRNGSNNSPAATGAAGEVNELRDARPLT